MKRLKYSTAKPKPASAPVNYAKADTSFDFGNNIGKKSSKPRKRKPSASGS